MNADEKTCPFCLETIKAGALRCKHCHADLTAIPSSTPPPSAASSDETGPVSLASGQVLDLLTHLVHKNLVVYEENESGQGRYRLLEMVRHYGRERLGESGEGEAVRGWHLGWVLQHVERATFDQLETEYDNLRAALEWCRARPENAGAEAVLPWAPKLGNFWWRHGDLREGRACLAWVLEKSGSAAVGERLGALHWAGSLAHFQNDFAQARSYHEQGLTLGREQDDKKFVSLTLKCLGQIAFHQENYEEAATFLDQALALRKEEGDYRGAAEILQEMGNLAVFQRDYQAAYDFVSECIVLLRTLGETTNTWTLLTLANAAQGLQRFEEAWRLYQEALSRFAQYQSKLGMAFTLERWALLAATQNQKERAARLVGASEALRQVSGSSVPPADHATFYDQLLADLRAALGETAFAALAAEGRTMTWEQVIHYALEENTP